MIVKEAIEILREEHDYAQMPCYVNQVLEMAIIALEKQIPKKPHFECARSNKRRCEDE